MVSNSVKKAKIPNPLPRDTKTCFSFTVKILKVADEGVHVRLYSNSFPSCPEELDIASLDFSPNEETGKKGMGHIPLSLDRFLAWAPSHVAKGEVSEDDLEGYHLWEEASGGYF